MSDLKTSAPDVSIRLIGPDLSERDLRLPEGSTLADLLGRPGAATENQTVLVNGLPPEALLPLHRAWSWRSSPSPGMADRRSRGGGPYRIPGRSPLTRILRDTPETPSQG